MGVNLENVSGGIEKILLFLMELVNSENRRGDNASPCGTPTLTLAQSEKVS